MTNDIHTQRLIFETEGGPKAEAELNKLADANQKLATSEEKKATAVKKATQEILSSRRGINDSYNAEVAAAARDADVVVKSEKEKVDAIGRTQSLVNAIARRVDPIGTMYRKAAKDVEDLNRAIASGVASGDPKKIEIANQAAEILPAAIKRRDQAQQAVAAAPDNKLTAEQERLNAAAEKYLDILDATRPATRAYNAELAQLAELQATTGLNDTQAASVHAKLTSEYEKRVNVLSGLAELERQVATEVGASAARFQQLQEKFDPATTSAIRMSSELADLNAAFRAGINIEGGYTAAWDRIVASYNEGSQAAQHARKEQESLNASAQRYRDELDPTLPVLREFEAELNQINVLARNKNLTPTETEELTARKTKQYDEKFDEASGAADVRRKAAEEQNRLTAAIERYLDIIDATRPATRAYNAELAQLAELQAKTDFSATAAASAEAKLTAEYWKKIHTLSGAAAAAKEQELLNASVQKYRDELDPTLPIMRAFSAEIAKISELESRGELKAPEAKNISQKITTDYTKKIAEANGSAEADRNAAKAAAEYQKQIEALKETIDPLATAERKRADSVSFANKALTSGDLNDRQHAAALRLASSNYDKATEAAKKHAAATNESTQRSQQMTFALTNLSYQINDVATSLASGISPARTFAQQAGQFVQVFQVNGGAKNVLSEVGVVIRSWITPMTAAAAGLGVLAVGMGLAVAKALELEKSSRTFAVALKGLGTSGLASSEDLQKQVRQLRDLGVAADDAQTAVTKVARTPGLNPARASNIVETGANLGAILGTDVTGGTDELTRALKDGPEAVIKIGAELGKLGPKEIEAIRTQNDLKGSVVATDTAYELLSRRIGGSYKDSLSDAAKAWIELKNAVNDFLVELSKSGSIQAILGELRGVLKGIQDSIKEVKDIIDAAKAAKDYVANKFSSFTFAGDRATKTAASNRDEMTSALSERDKAAGGTGNVVGALRFDTSKITTNTTALQELTTVLGEASREMPAGYGLVATSGQRHGTGGSLHNDGKAIDVQIVDYSSGRTLPNKGPIGSDPGLYKDLAVSAYRANERLFPGTPLTWGGRFETSAGSGMADWMHFDRGQDRGRFGPPLAAAAGQATTSASAADAARSVAAPGTSTLAPIDQTEKLDKQTREYTKANDAARKFADAQVYAEARLRGLTEAESRGYVGTVALTFADNAGKQAVTEAAIARDKASIVKDRETEGTLKSADAFKISEAAGYRVQAEEQARLEVMQRGGDVANRTRQILEEQASQAVQAGRQQTAAAQPQLVALERLAGETLKGTAAAHDQDIQNQAALRTQNALAHAEASRNPGLISQARALTDAALAEVKRADAARQSIAAAEAANDNKLTIQSTQLETTLTTSGLTTDQITRQLDYLKVSQDLNTKFRDASQESRDAYKDTSIAIADAKYQLTLAQREQEKWNNLVGDLANKIDSELTTSIENAFSGDKVESWGKRINKWLGSLSSQLSSSLFIKPALGTVAGALGFGTVSQSLGSFGSLGSLFGNSTSSASSGSSGGVSVTKANDGTVTITGLDSTASLNNSLFGTSGGGIFGNLFGSSETPSSASNDNIYGTLSGAGSKSLFNNTDSFLGTLSGSSSTGTIGGSLSSTGSSLFSLNTLKGVGAGFGAGTLLNSLIGGNKTTGTIGSGVGSLAGAALGSIFPGVGTTIGGIAGGLFGSLGGLFGGTSKPNNATGVSIDLSTGKASGFTSAGSKENDRTLKEVRDSITKFTTSLQSSTGGTTSGYINPQATDKGLKLDYNIPGFGSGTYNTTDSQEAIDNAELAIVKGLTGVSDLTQMVIDKYSGNIDDLKTALDAASTYKDTKVTDTIRTVVDKTSDPSKLSENLKFAGTYDKIGEAAKDAFASIPADLKTKGPFEKAKDDIKTTFDDITASAKEFGLSLEPVTAALDEANKRLKDDFNRNIKDILTAAEDPLQSLVDIEKRAGDARVKEAESVAGDIEAVNKLNAKNLDKIWTDQTASIKDLRDEFKTGDLSGLTDYQRLPAARTKYVDTLAAVQGGDTSKWDTLITDAKNLFSLSTGAYGQGPKTAQWRTAITAVLDNVLAGRTFAGGTKATPPGMVLVGEKGPELISQPGGLHVYPHDETKTILASMPTPVGLTVAPDTGVASSGMVLVAAKGVDRTAHPGGLQTDRHSETRKILTSRQESANDLVPGPRVHTFVAGTTATPPGTVLVGGRGLELISQPGSMHAYTHRETERLLSSGGAAQTATVPDSKVAHLAGRPLSPGTTGASSEVILVADRRLASISRERSPQIHSSRDTERVIATLAPAYRAASIANNNSSVASYSSTSVVGGSSSISNQNVATTLAKTLPPQVITAGTADARNGMGLIGPHGSGRMALPQERAIVNGATATPLETISGPGSLDVHSSREVGRIVSALAPGSVVPSSATSNLSVISDSSTAVSDNSSSFSVQNITAALGKTEPTRAFAGGTEATSPRAIMVSELIGMSHGRAFAAGTRATPPGTVLVGERGPELISQAGGLHVYTHRETEKILSAMPQTNGYAPAVASHRIEKPNVISLAVAREGVAATQSFAAGVESTPSGTILVGEKGSELIAARSVLQPNIPAMADRAATHIYGPAAIKDRRHEATNIISLAVAREEMGFTPSFVVGARATPPGMVPVGEGGLKLISQSGGPDVYAHTATENPLSVMPQIHGHAVASAVGGGASEKPSVISLAASKEGMAARHSYASGVKETPAGVILVGEQGPELVATPGAMQPHGPAVGGNVTVMMAAASGNVVSLLSHHGFRQGTSGQYHQIMPAANAGTLASSRGFRQGTSGQYDQTVRGKDPLSSSRGFSNGTSGQYDPMMSDVTLPSISPGRGFGSGTSGQYDQTTHMMDYNNISMSRVIGFWNGTSGQYDSMLPAANYNNTSAPRVIRFVGGTSGQYDSMLSAARINNISTSRVIGLRNGTSGQYDSMLPEGNYYNISMPNVSGFADGTSGQHDRVMPMANIVSISSGRQLWQGTSGQYVPVPPAENVVSVESGRRLWTGTSGQYDRMMPDGSYNKASMSEVIGFALGTSGQYDQTMPVTATLSAIRHFWQGSTGQYDRTMPTVTAVTRESSRGFWNGTSGQYDRMTPTADVPLTSRGFWNGTSGQYDQMAPAAVTPLVSRGFWNGTSGQYDRMMPATNVVAFSSTREFWNGTSGQYDRVMPAEVYNNISIPKISGFADGTSGQEPQLLAPPNFSARVPQGSVSPNIYSNEEVRKLLKDVVAAVKVNNNISRIGHYETGQELKTQTNELRKPTPHHPTRRRVA